MSTSYTVAGKSLAYQQGRTKNKSVASRPLNQGKPVKHSQSLASPTAAGLEADHRTGGSNITRGQPAEFGKHRRRGQQNADPESIIDVGNTNSNRTGHSQSDRKQEGSNIVTISDLKKTNVCVDSSSRTRAKPNTKPKPKAAAKGEQLQARSDQLSNPVFPTNKSSSSGTGRKLGPVSHERLNSSVESKVNTDKANQVSLNKSSIKLRSDVKKPQSVNPQVQSPTKPFTNNSPTKGRGVTRRGLPPKGKGTSGKMSYQGQGYSNRGLYSPTSRPVGQQSPSNPQGQGQSPASQGKGAPEEQGQQPQTAQYNGSGGYTKITPNERRRQQLTSKASQELADLEKRRAERRQARIEGPAQATGGVLSEEEARREMERRNQQKKYEKILKREQWQREKREREDKEIEEKKARAREKAKENERRRAERAASFLRNDHERTNEGFLQRLEAASSSSDTRDLSPSTSQELLMLRDMFPRKDPAKLQQMLELTGGDVNEVINLLQ